LDDGSAGLQAIKTRGGKTIVQDPEDAQIPAMPSNALSRVDVDYCLPLKDIPEALEHAGTTSRRRSVEIPRSEQMRKEVALEV